MSSSLIVAIISVSLVNLGAMISLYARFVVLERTFLALLDPNSPQPGFCRREQHGCQNWDARQISKVHAMPYDGQGHA